MMTTLRSIIVLLTISLLTACDLDKAPDIGAEQLQISGELSYRERIALPAGSQATITLDNTFPVDNDIGGQAAQKVIALDKKQVPIPFTLNVFRDQINPQAQYMVTATLAGPDGTVLWSLEHPVIINPHSTQNNLGTLWLTHAPTATSPMPIRTAFQCGPQHISLSFTETFAELEIGDDRYMLEQAISASGARYLSADKTVSFWNKGQRAWLEINGESYPECQEIGNNTPLPFHAQGNEPGWSLAASTTHLKLDWHYAEKHAVFHDPDIRQSYNQVIMQAKTEEGLNLQVIANKGICHDDMSGRAYPLTVTLKLDNEEMSGCGGDSYSLLTDKEWVVEDLNNKGIIDFSHISIQFDKDKRVSGLAGCNQYSATYDIGEQLSIKQVISTEKACAPALMNQEQDFLNLLSTIHHIDIDNTGALILSSDDGKTITARH